MAFQLELPPSMPIHNVFHVSLLKPYHSDGKRKPPPPPELVGSQLEYEGEMILSHRERSVGHKRVKEYLARRKGYGREHDTWEPEDNCQNCPAAVQEYWDTYAARQQIGQAQPKPVTRRMR